MACACRARACVAQFRRARPSLAMRSAMPSHSPSALNSQLSNPELRLPRRTRGFASRRRKDRTGVSSDTGRQYRDPAAIADSPLRTAGRAVLPPWWPGPCEPRRALRRFPSGTTSRCRFQRRGRAKFPCWICPGSASSECRALALSVARSSAPPPPTGMNAERVRAAADSSTVGQRIALHLSSESQDCEQVIAGP